MSQALPVIGRSAPVANTQQFGRPNDQEWTRNKLVHLAKSSARTLNTCDDTVTNTFVVRPKNFGWLPIFGVDVNMWFIQLVGMKPYYLGADGVIYRRFDDRSGGDYCNKADLKQLTTKQLNALYDELNTLTQRYAA